MIWPRWSTGENCGTIDYLSRIIWYLGVLDKNGFRSNVGIMLADGQGRLLWARRVGQDAWQFPQGGINSRETPQDAVFRELYEEIGLQPEDVALVSQTRGWLHYRLPQRYIRRNSHPVCVGQKQKWFLLQLLGEEEKIRFDCGDKPEFDHWRWVSYWYPVQQVVEFKRDVYRRALKELAPAHSGIECTSASQG